MAQTTETFKYFAFISYNSRDLKWGKQLQRKLERYRMPATLCSEKGWERKPMSPIFFAPTDIQPGELNNEIKERLTASRHLIVICSPNSAQSAWVAREIAFFHSMGRTKDIHFFIVEGEPHSGNPQTECFNPIVHELGLPEILGVNINERIYDYPWLNRERAYVQLITKLLGIEYDHIWQRHKRLMKQQIAILSLVIIAVIGALIGVWQMSRPVDIRMQAVEASVPNDRLPALQDAIVSLELENETKTDTLRNAEERALFANIPTSHLGKEARISVRCRNFLPLDTLMILSKDVQLNLYRDASVYGDVHFRVWNLTTEKAMPHLPLIINGTSVTSDASGRVSLHIPLAEQRTAYEVSATVPLGSHSIQMPCGEDDILIVNE